MIEFINEHGILLYLAVLSVCIIGLAGLYYLAVFALVFVLKETLRAFGILQEFVRWRNQRPVHPGTLPEDEREKIRKRLTKEDAQ